MKKYILWESPKTFLKKSGALLALSSSTPLKWKNSWMGEFRRAGQNWVEINFDPPV